MTIEKLLSCHLLRAIPVREASDWSRELSGFVSHKTGQNSASWILRNDSAFPVSIRCFKFRMALVIGFLDHANLNRNESFLLQLLRHISDKITVFSVGVFYFFIIWFIRVKTGVSFFFKSRVKIESGLFGDTTNSSSWMLTEARSF